MGRNGITCCPRRYEFTFKSVQIGSTPVLKIALPSSPLPAGPAGELSSLAPLIADVGLWV